jgi:hypothetical protein
VTELVRLIEKHRRNGLLVDANLLLLLLVGRTNETRISKFKRTHAVVRQTQEFYNESAGLAGEPTFQKLGLTDAGIRKVAERPLLVLTDDLPLYHHLREAGLDAINFNHLRTYLWGS